MQVIQGYFGNLGFGEPDLAGILPFFTKQVYAKGDYFSIEGKTNPYLGFIEEGVFQYFFLHRGNETTTYVTGQNGWLASLLCILRGQPARENIRAITDAVVWKIHSHDFAQLMDKFPALHTFYVKMIEYQLLCIDDSRFGLLTLSAEERYQKLIETEPTLLQQIPLQLLASTLGITPRHLSRIRKNIK